VIRSGGFRGDSGQGGNPEAASPPANPNGVNYQNQSQRDIQSYNAQQQQAYRQQPGMGGMGGGSGLTFGSGGMGLSMGGGGLGALLGLLGGAGGSAHTGWILRERVWFAGLRLLGLRCSWLWIVGLWLTRLWVSRLWIVALRCSAGLSI